MGGKKTSKKKRDQLGMPHGTAASLLRKKLAFGMICELGRNVCYRCREIIKTEDELSIEHKVPWLDSNDPVGLFFSINNLAYSHRVCNSSNARHMGW